MVFQEMKSNTCTAKNSSTDALLWLKRYTTLLMLFSYLLVSLWNENKEKLYETLTLSQNLWGKFILQNINFKNQWESVRQQFSSRFQSITSCASQDIEERYVDISIY